ncbi:MAG: hypothetical protein ABI573_07080 [Chloroflexota bacterium]
MTAALGLGLSLLAVLSRPRWWILALAAFLLRGGLVLVLLPLIPLPSTAALANALGPTLVGFVFGGPSVPFLILVGSTAGLALAWFVLSGVVGAAIDLALIRDAAAEDDLEDRAQPIAGGPWRAVAVRWLAHVPTAVAIAVGMVAVVNAAYGELIRPGDPAVPIAIRVILQVPVNVAAIVTAWIFGEAVGGIAERRLAWGAGIARALGGGVVGLLRPTGLLVLFVTNGALLAVIIGGDLAIGLAFEHARIAILDGTSVFDRGLALGFLSVSWIATTVLIAFAAAWRSTAWTFEIGRRQPVLPHPAVHSST